MVLLCTMMFTVSCGDSKEADKPEDSGDAEQAAPETADEAVK